MDVIEKTLSYQIEDIKFWSGITNVKESPKPEWPIRMIFRFCIAAKACYEIIARDVELKDENIDDPDIFDPYSMFDLYYTDIAKWNDGHSRFKREFIQSGNLTDCLNGAKRDFEDMLNDDGYCLEIYPLSDYSEEEKIQTYKALSCQVIEYNDTIPSTVEIMNIETKFSKKPFNKSIKCVVDSWIGACEYSGVIPVNKTYDIYEQREIVEKIIRDEFYKWKAEKEEKKKLS